MKRMLNKWSMDYKNSTVKIEAAELHVKWKLGGL